MRSLPVLTLSFVALTIGCVETATGPDLVGVWQVTAQTENPTGCTPGPAVTGPPYIQFTQEELFGQTFFQWAACTSPTTCEMPNPLFDLAYAKAIAGGFEAQAYTASGDATACSLGAVVSTAIVAADGALTIETRTLTKSDVTGTTCQTEEAQAALNAGQLTCGSLAVLTATRP
ncbi:MAG: hypothetical protein IPL61_40200 [Myxococcales bacterium]|nr:hypothetical protein [Myxococcales bacterium]